MVASRNDEEEEEGSGEFEVIVSLVSADDSAASGHIIRSAVGGLVSMAVVEQLEQPEQRSWLKSWRPSLPDLTS